MIIRRIIVLILILTGVFTTSAQYLYPEHYTNKVNQFTLDNGQFRVVPLQGTGEKMQASFNAKALKEAKGTLLVQIIVDTTGRAFLLSADNKTGVTSKNLNLEKAINSTLWKPAEPAQNVSISLMFEFSNGTFRARAVSPMEYYSDVKEPITDGSDPKDLSYTFHLNKLPEKASYSSRGITIDSSGTVWVGTDNGLVLLRDGKTKLFNYTNSPLTQNSYKKNQTDEIFRMITDKENNVWIIQGYTLFRVKDGQWTKFDTLNSPVVWGRQLFVDDENHLWITTWRGICEYDGEKWSVLDSTNSGILSNQVLSFYIDRQGRKWVGTFYGNAMFDGTKWNDYRSSKTPLGKSYIDWAYQDSKGNMWFTFYANRDDIKGGLYMLDTKGKWHKYAPKWTKVMERECTNDVIYDESRGQIWIAVNTIGLFLFDVKRNHWEVYTPDNSNLPSEYIMQLCQDKYHNLWGGMLYGDVFKLEKK
ncbi:MAG: hypothetical protein K6A41_01615 [Bacteroidales bacterium]|nr:hypothetical protein [Bacteroidales bacterium]